jgi:hypothetical protein
MKQILVLIGTTLCLGGVAASASAPLHKEQVSFPGGTATFYVRGTNVIYERVGYQESGPYGGKTNSWVERFYYQGELVFRRCRNAEQVTEMSLGTKGVSVFIGHKTTDPKASPSGILQIAEVGKSSVPGGKDWVPPFELFSMGSDGFYYPEDPMQLGSSSFLWMVDVGNPTVDTPEQEMRMRLLGPSKGLPVGQNQCHS